MVVIYHKLFTNFLTMFSLLFFHRLAELTGYEEDWRSKLKKGKSSDMVQTSLADRFSQLQDSENSWKKKVDTYAHTATHSHTQQHVLEQLRFCN